MGKENITIIMEIDMKENGKRGKNMEKEYIIV